MENKSQIIYNLISPMFIECAEFRAYNTYNTLLKLEADLDSVFTPIRIDIMEACGNNDK